MKLSEINVQKLLKNCNESYKRLESELSNDINAFYVLYKMAKNGEPSKNEIIEFVEERFKLYFEYSIKKEESEGGKDE
jgi:hypothetical protein